jgi:rubredoxin-NAD+ reductase
MTDRPVIVVGSGLAGWTTVRELRKLDPHLPITMLSADAGHFYAKPSLSNALAQGRAPQQLVTTQASAMAQSQNVTLLADTPVLSIDPAGQSLRTAQDVLSWRALVLATGARPIRAPIEGDAADAVLSVNSLDDFAAFHGRLKPGARVLIIGAGLIGCEFANDLALAGHGVSVVDPAGRPLEALLPEAASLQLQQALDGLGVHWHFGCTVSRVQRTTEAATGATLGVTLSDGSRVPADLVLSAIGLRPDTALASAAGLVCERGIVVDGLLQTSSAGIHALGDAAQYGTGRWREGPVDGARTMPYVMPIMTAARALAATLNGQATEVKFPVMPVAVKTPACALVLVAPPPGTPGQWQDAEPGIWQFVRPDGRIAGFVLSGKQPPAQRARMTALLSA